MSDEPLDGTEKSSCTEWHCVSPGVAQPGLSRMTGSFCHSFDIRRQNS